MIINFLYEIKNLFQQYDNNFQNKIFIFLYIH